MRVIYVLLVLQIIVSTVILTTSSKSGPATEVRRTLKNVLGMSIIAQDVQTDTPTPEQSKPIDTPTPETSNPTDMPIPESSNAVNTPTHDQSSPTDITKTVGPSPTDTPTPIESGQLNPVLPIDQIEPIEGQPYPNEDLVTNPGDLISNSQDINNQAIEQAKIEDQAVASATGENAAELLVTYAANKTSGLDSNIKTDDFSAVSFLTQRFNSQFDQIQEITRALVPSSQTKVLQKLRQLCTAADYSLKTQQLVVPEDLEQDIEIARGKCFQIAHDYKADRTN